MGGSSLAWLGHELVKLNGIGSILTDFEQMCKIDLRLKEGTTNIHLRYIKRYLEFCKKKPDLIALAEVLRCLSELREGRELYSKVARSKEKTASD